jgi:hypothetical protein
VSIQLEKKLEKLNDIKDSIFVPIELKDINIQG